MGNCCCRRKHERLSDAEVTRPGQGPPACDACGKELKATQRCRELDDLRFHVGCYKCVRCSMWLEKAFRIGARPYCRGCYNKATSNEVDEVVREGPRSVASHVEESESDHSSKYGSVHLSLKERRLAYEAECSRTESKSVIRASAYKEERQEAMVRLSDEQWSRCADNVQQILADTSAKTLNQVEDLLLDPLADVVNLNNTCAFDPHSDYGHAKLATAITSAANQNIKTFSMANAGVDNHLLAVLCTSLATLPSLTLVDLTHNAFSEQGLQSLAELVRSSSSLRELRFSSVHQLSPDCERVLVKAVQETTGLLKLGYTFTKSAKKEQMEKRVYECLAKNRAKMRARLNTW